jgi:hypothetical protein
MAGNCKGLFKIGDKIAGLVTHVQVVDDFTSSCWPMKTTDYIERGLLPSLDNLPWREDWAARSLTRARQ